MEQTGEGKTVNVTVRRANPGDKTAVLEINKNVYDGLDYLPYLYDSLMLDDNYTYYVAEVDNSVVAIYGVCLIDGGKTLMARSGRVRADYEGQGILGHILQAVYRDFSPLYHVNRDLKVAVALGDTCALINRSSFRSISELVWIRNQKVFQGNLSVLSPDRSDPPKKTTHRLASAITELSQEDFIHLVNAMDSRQRFQLFPKDVFTTFTWHFQLAQLAASRNVWGRWDPHFTATSSLVDTAQQPQSGGLEDADPENPCHETAGACLGLLSASMIVRTPSGPMVFLDIFGSVTESEDLSSHLKLFLSGLPGRWAKQGLESNRFYVVLFTNSGEEEEIVSRELEQLGFADIDYRMRKMCYFWQSFETLKTS